MSRDDREREEISLLFVGLDVPDLTAVGTTSRCASLLDRRFCSSFGRRHGTFGGCRTGGGGGETRSAFLLLTLLATLLILLETLFFLPNPK